MDITNEIIKKSERLINVVNHYKETLNNLGLLNNSLAKTEMIIEYLTLRIDILSRMNTIHQKPFIKKLSIILKEIKKNGLIQLQYYI